MRVIYIDTDTFRISLERTSEQQLEKRVECFDGFADEEIEQYWLYIPSGFRYFDDITGMHYSGEMMRPIENYDRYMVRTLSTEISKNTDSVQKVTNRVVNIMGQTDEQADGIVELAEMTADIQTTQEEILSAQQDIMDALTELAEMIGGMTNG